MSDNEALMLCYNRGCGQKFDPAQNKNDSCQNHPGQPVFHDAYKGWSCCNKKCTDFSEFLSIKGCTKSKHSNIKPPEPPKPVVDKSKTNEIIEVFHQPINNIPKIERPPFNSPQITLKPTVSSTLLEQIIDLSIVDDRNKYENKVVIGQNCKNNSCKSRYQGPMSNEEVCAYHSGVPIFHEGIKYWSCCQKKTTDFTVFLEQPGCTEGSHVWVQKDLSDKKVQCRLDWHQTGTHVVVSVYAKKYNPDLSFVKLNAIRLTMSLYFAKENSRYDLDMELKGVVDVEASSVNMLPTKTEIKLKKKEPGLWTKLDIPRQIVMEKAEVKSMEENISCQVNAVDLSDI